MSPERRIVVASQNPGKAREIARILDDWDVTSLADFPPVDFPEEGGDFFLTPYEMVRQHADLEIWPESGGDKPPVLILLYAVQSLRNNLAFICPQLLELL